MTGQAQISDLEVIITVDEDICRLQIPMHNSLLVHVLERASHLVDVLPDALLGELDIFFDGAFEHEFEIALFRPLDRDK